MAGAVARLEFGRAVARATDELHALPRRHVDGWVHPRPRRPPPLQPHARAGSEQPAAVAASEQLAARQ
eukprot:2120759-Prymnesium_polylepis.1